MAVAHTISVLLLVAVCRSVIAAALSLAEGTRGQWGSALCDPSVCIDVLRVPGVHTPAILHIKCRKVPAQFGYIIEAETVCKWTASGDKCLPKQFAKTHTAIVWGLQEGQHATR